MPAPRQYPTDPPAPLRKPPTHHHHPRPLPAHHRISIPPNPKKVTPTPTPHHRSTLTTVGAFCLWALFCLFLLFIFILVAGAIIYAWLRPHAPEFHLQTLNITTLTTDQNQLTSTIDMSLEVYNRNDAIQFRYDRIRISVFHKTKIARAAVPAFMQKRSNVTVVAVEGGVTNEKVSGDVGQDLAASFGGGKMVVDVQVDCMVDSFIGEWHTGGFPIKALCMEVEVSRLVAGFRPKCPVYLYGWIGIW